MLISVFVIMPFQDEFDSVFDDFIKPAFESLESSQFQVTRADDISNQNQRNILHDIVTRIANSDLVVADLTGSNPNVFYELGLAHALRRPTILLTQDVEEVPFDLNSYRILEYDTHFVRIQVARDTLEQFATDFAAGRIQFSNPVIDFLVDDGTHVENQQVAIRQQVVEQADERGFLDHIVDVSDGYMELGDIATDLTNSIQQDVAQPMVVATEEIHNLTVGGRMTDPRSGQSVARRLAPRITRFNDKLTDANKRYAEILQRTEHSLELAVRFTVDQLEQVNEDELNEHLNALRDFRDTMRSARQSSEFLAETSDGIPRMERRLNRALSDLSKQLRVFGVNGDRTIASIERALAIWDNRRRLNGSGVSGSLPSESL